MPSSVRPSRLLILLLPALLLAATFGPAPAHAAPAAGKIERKVLDDTAGGKPATFIVTVKGDADLAAAATTKGRAQRARPVTDRLRATADRSQAGLRAELRAKGAEATHLWIVNALIVRGDRELTESLAARPEVERITASSTITIPDERERAAPAQTGEAEWNVERVRAPEVWSKLSTRGEGVVVATIDSGADDDHPALAAAYRGRNADGTLSHDHNWRELNRECSDGSDQEPCDRTGHGTHATGTMVGDGGAGNRIGLAPGAKWIAAKACYAVSEGGGSACESADRSRRRSGSWPRPTGPGTTPGPSWPPTS